MDSENEIDRMKLGSLVFNENNQSNLNMLINILFDTINERIEYFIKIFSNSWKNSYIDVVNKKIS